MLQKTREDKSGEALEVNERILDSCTELMKVSLLPSGSLDSLKFETFSNAVCTSTSVTMQY